MNIFPSIKLKLERKNILKCMNEFTLQSDVSERASDDSKPTHIHLA